MKKGTQRKPLNPLLLAGAGGRNRTDMELPPRDFESRASTSFTTPAILLFFTAITLPLSTCILLLQRLFIQFCQIYIVLCESLGGFK